MLPRNKSLIGRLAMRYFTTIIIAACFLCIPAKSFAEIFTKITPELRYIKGDTTYHISFDETWANGGHGESELEFPIDNLMIGIGLVVGSKHEKTGQTMGQFSLTLLYTPSGDAGTMKDSDWIENDAAFGETSHAGKDLYTESDAHLTGMIFDINYAYHFRYNNSWTLGPMLGFRHQKFEYDVTGGGGMYWTTPVFLEGKLLDYEVTYSIPYIGLSSNLLFGKNNQFQFNSTFSYSDWAKASDRDDHILRYKLAEGDCDGEAYLVNLTGDWKFHPDWILSLGAEYVDIDTSGSQHQGYYAGPYTGTTLDVNDEITFSYWSAMLRISYIAF